MKQPETLKAMLRKHQYSITVWLSVTLAGFICGRLSLDPWRNIREVPMNETQAATYGVEHRLKQDIRLIFEVCQLPIGNHSPWYHWTFLVDHRLIICDEHSRINLAFEFSLAHPDIWAYLGSTVMQYSINLWLSVTLDLV